MSVGAYSNCFALLQPVLPDGGEYWWVDVSFWYYLSTAAPPKQNSTANNCDAVLRSKADMNLFNLSYSCFFLLTLQINTVAHFSYSYIFEWIRASKRN